MDSRGIPFAANKVEAKYCGGQFNSYVWPDGVVTLIVSAVFLKTRWSFITL
jgi:hypothetical protein